MKNATNQKLLEKIAKMLEMAKRSKGNEAEAAVAASMVEKLMRKHNLTISDITPQQAKSEVTQNSFNKAKWTTGKCPVWVNRLAIAVADTYETFCVFSEANTKDSHVAKTQYNLSFVGLELDVAVSVEMFEYLYTTIERLSNEFFKENPAPKGKTRTYKNAFRDGMTMRLQEKLKAMANEKKAEQENTCRGLMVVKENAISEFLGFKTEYAAKKRKTTDNSYARSAGYHKGGSVSLNKQMH